MTAMEDSAIYFLDRELAHETALKKNYFKVGGLYDITQICYYDGLPFQDAPDNLIHVPVEKFAEYFSTTGLRLPLKFIGRDAEDHAMGSILAHSLEEVRKTRNFYRDFYANILLRNKPDFRNDRPWRIYLPTSRYTDVWQYCLKNLAKALRKKGCDARVFIEEHDMQNHLEDTYRMFKYAAEFKPHIWISISQGDYNFLNPDMFHIIWWQDPLPCITNGNRLNWRDRDIIFSQYSFVDDLLRKTGVREVIRQGIGIDADVYKLMPDVQRRRKVVFIGSSYSMPFKRKCSKFQNNDNVLREIETLFIAGLPVTKEKMAQLGSRYNIPERMIYEWHANYIARERTVEWLCQYSSIEVEIYGRHWENNEIVRPFFKGELPYGEAVAEVYNGAEYAIAVNTAEINTQRLAEMSACGCIPIVYDCRHHAEKPHWDDECLFFRTREELYSCFTKTPAGNPVDISKASSYDAFADKILSMITERAGI